MAQSSPSAIQGYFLGRRVSQRSFVQTPFCLLVTCAVLVSLTGDAVAQATIPITVQTTKLRQTYDGVGAGAIFYEGHITSLAVRARDERQQQLYDDMFTRIPSRYLQLMIREVHEPQNDNDDPYTPAFDDKNFE